MNEKIIIITSIKKNKNINLIIEGIKEKKGEDIVLINLQDIDNAPCSFFVICTANSKIQINAIASNIEKLLLDKMNIKLWRDEGKETNWRLLDYFDIVIHVFKKESREHYNLAELWADGLIKKIG